MTYQFEYVSNAENVYCIGCELTPIKVTRPDGSTFYTWVVESIEEDVFQNGVYVEANSWGQTLEQLIERKEEEKLMAIVRPDIREREYAVPIGDNDYYGGAEPIPYRWVNETEEDEGEFEVYYNGKWQTARSIDFDFLPTSNPITSTT